MKAQRGFWRYLWQNRRLRGLWGVCVVHVLLGGAVRIAESVGHKRSFGATYVIHGASLFVLTLIVGGVMYKRQCSVPGGR